jgi:hypothetical protein
LPATGRSSSYCFSSLLSNAVVSATVRNRIGGIVPINSVKN